MQTKSGRSKSSKIIADGFHYGNKIGAIEKGASLEVLLFIPYREAALEVSACIRKDYEDWVQRIPMTRSGWDGDQDIYTCMLPTDRIGLFWYWFELETGSGYGIKFSRAEGGRVSFAVGHEMMQPLQLTVYERRYEEPFWLKGGIIYQVFIDRFCRGADHRTAGIVGDEEAAADHPDESGDSTAFRQMEALCEADPVKRRYHIRAHDEWYDNRNERSIVLRDKWGAAPIWWPDQHGEVLNNDFFGGNLAGIREKLPYLKSLGVTCLYLNPIFESYSNHRYDTGDYMKIDALIGDEEEFRLLCEEAKAAGIAVMLDGVFNHTGDDSLYFNRYGTYDSVGAWNHEDSPYRGWYDWYGYYQYHTWWGIRTLPTVSKNCDAQKEMLFGQDGVVRRWIRAGAAGWRLDVVDELPTDYLRQLTKAVKEEKADAVVMGEVWEDASNKIAYENRRSYFQGEELDSVMNYPWKNAILSYLRDGEAGGLGDSITQICTNYPPEVLSCLMNPLGTHDSVRALTALAGKELNTDDRSVKYQTRLSEKERKRGRRLLKLAVLIQMFLPGVPSIYYGDEAGMEGYNDPFNRRCYPWGEEDEELLQWFRTVTGIRSERRAFFGEAECEVLHAADGIFAFRRNLDGKSFVCMVNRGHDAFSTMATTGYTAIPRSALDGMEREFVGRIERSGKSAIVHIPGEYGCLLLEGSPEDKIDLMYVD